MAENVAQVAERASKRPGSPLRETQPKSKKPDVASETLYVHNLAEHLAIADLRTELYMLFSTYGHLVAVNAFKSPKMRGQAFVVYGNAQSAHRALSELQGREFIGKQLKIDYAKTKSHRIEWLTKA